MSDILAPSRRSRRAGAGSALKVRKYPRRESMDTLAKGLSVIRAFSRDCDAMRLCDVAKLTSMAPATARRCLMALEDLGYIVRYGSFFSLRPKVLELTAAYLDSMHLETLTKHLQSLTENTGDSSAVCVLDGAEIVYVAHADVKAQIRLGVHIGSRFPAQATSGGRVLLAGLDPVALKASLSTLVHPVRDEETLLNNAAIPAVLEKCRRNGYSAVADELDGGIVSIAVPILDQRGRVMAALCSAGQSRRISMTKLVRERLVLLQTLSRQITADLFLSQSLSVGSRGQAKRAAPETRTLARSPGASAAAKDGSRKNLKRRISWSGLPATSRDA